MKNLEDILRVWMKSWLKTNRKVPFPRKTCDALRKINVSAHELQEFIGIALVTKEDERTKPMRNVLKQYSIINREAEYAKTEDLCENPQGLQFLLKAQHGYEDKQTVKVEDGSLADIIAKNSAHKGK